ncbi:hypothetical protein VTO73DRAFT_15590 [Trametes versicolor]
MDDTPSARSYAQAAPRYVRDATVPRERSDRASMAKTRTQNVHKPELARTAKRDRAALGNPAVRPQDPNRSSTLSLKCLPRQWRNKTAVDINGPASPKGSICMWREDRPQLCRARSRAPNASRTRDTAKSTRERLRKRHAAAVVPGRDARGGTTRSIALQPREPREWILPSGARHIRPIEMLARTLNLGRGGRGVAFRWSKARTNVEEDIMACLQQESGTTPRFAPLFHGTRRPDRTRRRQTVVQTSPQP